MTTITKEQIQKIIDAADEVITALAGTNDDFHPDNSTNMVRLYDDLNDRYAPPEFVRELALIALAVLTAEPVRYMNKFSGTCVTLEQQPNAADDVAVYIPLYAVPSVQETGIYKDVLNIISLLENNEWAEHCTSTVLGSLLESEITRLVGKEQPAPVMPDECPAELLAFCEQVIDSRITANAKADELWSACRASMLNGGKS